MLQINFYQLPRTFAPNTRATLRAGDCSTSGATPTAEPYLLTRHQFTWVIPPSRVASSLLVQPHNFSSDRTSLGNPLAVKKHPNIARPLVSTTHSCLSIPPTKTIGSQKISNSTATALTTIPIS